MKRYHHLSLEEREKLFCLHEQRISLREIAKVLGRSDTSLGRELKRNKTGQGQRSHEYFASEYLPATAQKKAKRIAQKQRRKAPLKEPLIWLYVREHLRQPFNWTPEEISGTLSKEHPLKCISPEAIYQYIYRESTKRYKLWKLLSHSRKYRMKKLGRKIQRAGHIPGSISIEKRPTYIQKRRQLGHWETDNIVGKMSDETALSVTVERVTRFTIITKLKDRSAQLKSDALIQRLGVLTPKARRTITADNGKENSHHSKVKTCLGMQMYFTHSYASWEKGSVENMNGRIRRYIPKGVSIDSISEEYIQRIEDKLNNTPRKCLNYLTPQQRMNILIATT